MALETEVSIPTASFEMTSLITLRSANYRFTHGETQPLLPLAIPQGSYQLRQFFAALCG